MSKFKVGDRVRLTKSKPLPWQSIDSDQVRKAWERDLIFTIKTIASWGPFSYVLENGLGFLEGELEPVEAPACPQPESRPDAERIQELLEANNALVEREREAKRELARIQTVNRSLVTTVNNHEQRYAALEDINDDLRQQNACQAALLEKAERSDTANMPVTGHIVWMTPEGEVYRFDKDEGSWVPATLSMRPVSVL